MRHFLYNPLPPFFKLRLPHIFLLILVYDALTGLDFHDYCCSPGLNPGLYYYALSGLSWE